MAPGSGTDMAGRPLRMPKLTYRNPLPADQLSLSSQATSASDIHSTSTHQERLSTPDSNSMTSSPVRPHFDSRSNSSSTLPSSDASTSKEPKPPKKKKANGGILGFLTLKEPSQLALEQFAEQQRKQSSTGGASSSVNSFVSAQKLPPNVPKVNSKWDGVPESIKSRKRDSKSSSKRSSTTSSSQNSTFTVMPNESIFSIASEQSRNPPNSLVSRGPSISERRDSGPSLNTLDEEDNASTTALPESANISPDDPSSRRESTREYTDETMAEAEPSKDTISTCDSPMSSSGNTPIYIDPSVDSKADVIFKRLNERKQQRSFLTSEEQEVRLRDQECSEGVPETHDFLFNLVPLEQTTPASSSSSSPSLSPSPSPPIPEQSPMRGTTNFSRPTPISPQSYSKPVPKRPHPAPNFQRPMPHRYQPPVSALPTLYEASIASTDDNRTEQNESISESDAESIAPSITASEAPSVAQSEMSTMSASWYRSPKERLGLGGRLRKREGAPWEAQTSEELPAPSKVVDTANSLYSD